MEPTPWPHVFRQGRSLFTENADPGHRSYGEEVRAEGGRELRAWDPWRSKLAAFLVRADRFPPLPEPVRAVLYLGGAHGTTVSHISDIFPSARIVVVEKSPESFGSLLELSRRRSNLTPILADAQLPERYAADVGPVDFVYQDVAQRSQVPVLLENAGACLDAAGASLLMLKVRSVTQRRPPAAIVEAARRELERAGWRVDRPVDLAPFARQHAALWLRPSR